MLFCKVGSYQKKRSDCLVVTSHKNVPLRPSSVPSAQQRLAVRQQERDEQEKTVAAVLLVVTT